LRPLLIAGGARVVLAATTTAAIVGTPKQPQLSIVAIEPAPPVRREPVNATAAGPRLQSSGATAAPARSRRPEGGRRAGAGVGAAAP